MLEEGRGYRGGEQHPMCGEGDRTIVPKYETFECSHLWCVVRGGWTHCGRGGVEMLNYLSCSEGVSCSTSSNMWGSWYFPRFLLRDQSFTQMYMAFLMVLATPYASLFTIVKHFKSTGCPVVWLCWWIGDGIENVL